VAKRRFAPALNDLGETCHRHARSCEMDASGLMATMNLSPFDLGSIGAGAHLKTHLPRGQPLRMAASRSSQHPRKQQALTSAACSALQG